MKATVSLKEGRTYTWGPHVFTKSPQVVTDRDAITQLQKIGVLSVVVSEDEPIAPPPGVDDVESGEGDEYKPDPVIRKPAQQPKAAGSKPGQNKGQFKATNKTPPKAAPAPEPEKE